MTDKQYNENKLKLDEYTKLKNELENNKKLLDELQTYPSSNTILTLNYKDSGKTDLFLPQNLTFQFLEDICGELVRRNEQIKLEMEKL